MKRALAALAVLLVSAPIGFEGLKYAGARIGLERGLTSERIRLILTSAQLSSAPGGGPDQTAQCLVPLRIRVDEVNAALRNVVLWQEDHTFKSHDGSSLWRTFAALVRSVGSLAGLSRRQGGSTITQQLVKNTVFVPGDTVWTRKLLEPGYARLFEAAANKDELLAAYLNAVPFLDGVTGVEAFARRHFGKSASSLTLYEAAQFTRALNSPARYDPSRHPKASRAGALKLLKAMHEGGAITREAWRAAVAQASGARIAGDQPIRVGCGYLKDAVRALGPSIPTGPYRKYVTFDGRREIEALAAVATHAPALAAAGGSEVAFVSLDTEGGLQALVGHTEAVSSTWDAALQTRRPVGSLGKLAVLAAACEAGLTPDSRVLDAPQVDGWPRNYDGVSHGRVTIAQLAAYSYNQAAVRAEQLIGITRVVAAAHRIGFTEARPALGTSLGAFDASPLDVASVVAAVANAGRRVRPYVVTLIVGPVGRIVYEHRPPPRTERVMSAKCADMLRAVLTGVVREGTASPAGFAIPAFGKTGTTSDYADAWFVGHASSATTAVWVGNRSPKIHMRGVTGGGIPARIVADYANWMSMVQKRTKCGGILQPRVHRGRTRMSRYGSSCR